MERAGVLKVALVDRHELFADCLGIVLSMRGCESTKVPVRDEPGEAHRIVAQVLAARPAVAVLGTDLPALRTVIDGLARAGVAVVVLTDGVVESQWGDYLAQGSRVVISRTEPLTRVVSAVRLLGSGRRVLDSTERERLITAHRQHSWRQQSILDRLDRLTGQEAQVLRHLMAGETVREVAAVRVVAEATVRTQVKSILAKLEVSSQISAVALGHRAGWRAAVSSTAS